MTVWSHDEEVDEHYNSLFRELLTYMMGDPRMISPCAHLLFVAKNLERIGDHATNVAEIIHYEITGEEVDNAHNSVFRELLTYMLEDPRKITPCIDLIFIAKNLERIGDHATNIAEKIHYMIHGDEINRSRDEER